MLNIHGTTRDNGGFCFGETDVNNFIRIKANSPFNETYPVRIYSECNLADLREISMEFINQLLFISENDPLRNIINGSIPDDIPDGTIMAIIRDFKFSLNETRK